MGYQMDQFLSQVELDEEFICSICQDVIKHPIMTQPCQHIFCTSCLQDWMTKSETCPTDRKPITGLGAPFRVYMNMYNRLKIKCGFQGCPDSSSLEEAEAHANACQYNPEAIKPCVHGCGAEVKMREVSSHSCVTYLKLQLNKQHAENVKVQKQLEEQIDLLLAEKEQHQLAMTEQLRIKDVEIETLKGKFVENMNEIEELKVKLEEKEVAIKQLKDYGKVLYQELKRHRAAADKNVKEQVMNQAENNIVEPSSSKMFGNEKILVSPQEHQPNSLSKLLRRASSCQLLLKKLNIVEVHRTDMMPQKKNYLRAGLLSKVYKGVGEREETAESYEAKLALRLKERERVQQHSIVNLVLPAPSYAHRYVCEKRTDFLLPYNIWCYGLMKANKRHGHSSRVQKQCTTLNQLRVKRQREMVMDPNPNRGRKRRKLDGNQSPTSDDEDSVVTMSEEESGSESDNET